MTAKTNTNDKLKKANRVLEEIAKTIPHITPVTPADRALFEDFFNREARHTYGNSWIYVTQGVYGIGPNNLGYKYYDGENLCMLCIYPKIEQPDILMMYWVRPLGNSMLDIIAALATQIQKKYGISCYVKKLFKDQYDYLVAKGFKDARLFPWHSSCPLEDDTFPEMIFNRIETLNAVRTSGRKKDIGNSFREALKLAWDNKMELTEKNFSKNAFKITQQYFEDLYKNTKKINISSVIDYINMISDSFYGDNIRKLILVNDVPMGFFITQTSTIFNTNNIYAHFALRERLKYLSDYLLIKLFETCGSTYINWGGSEDIGIHRFKAKYHPIKKNKMYWVTNYPL
ncbi:MAG: hypothetical protein JW855_02455 [Gammaproteobacteria bacterium]|nr:hypothetical protein [Gammaproteobacteria bacterium]